jgi:pteridine reductase
MTTSKTTSSQDDKTALVTGGARRIGAAIASRLHEAGWRVAIHYRHSREEAEALARELNTARAGSAVTVQAALDDAASCGETLREAIARCGRLDALVNNASVFRPTSVDEASQSDWQTLIASNMQAPFFLAQAAAPALRESGGAVVNLVDIYAERPLAGHPIYSATKAGLASLTRALAQDLAPHVRVNGVAPGAILWPEKQTADEAAQQVLLARTPLARMGTPGDIAAAANFLLSAEAAYITGQVLAVDGGRSVVP